MKDLGPRYEFHCHTIFSDGRLLPLSLALEAEYKDHAAIALTDHVDPSNLEWAVTSLVRLTKEMDGQTKVRIIPGAEVSYLPPDLIEKYCLKARQAGAKIIVVHGESPNEPAVPKGTNAAALKLKGLVNILAHPGWITDEDVKLAKANDIYLELSARPGHQKGNKHVAKLAGKIGARLLVNTDAHTADDLINQEQAFKIAKLAGLNKDEAIRTICHNPLELLKKI